MAGGWVAHPARGSSPDPSWGRAPPSPGPPQRSSAALRSQTAGPVFGRRPGAEPQPFARAPPTLGEAAVEALMSLGGGGVYADCTFGSGGHARLILAGLAADGALLAIDVDPAAIAEAASLAAADGRVRPYHLAHSELEAALPEGRELSGALFDLGLHEASERDPQRGFSLHEDVPCDLRMNPTLGLSAAEWLSEARSDELAWIIREYGDDEDPLVAARIAEALVQLCRGRPLRTSREIAGAVSKAKGGVDARARHPARSTFQALRTFLNREPQQLRAGLEAAFRRLRTGGRCVVICYSRWELITAKRFMRDHEDFDRQRVRGWSAERLSHLFPLLATDTPWAVREVCSPLAPTPVEADANWKVRTARAVVLEKVSRASAQSQPHLRPAGPHALERLLFERPTQLPTFAGEADGAAPSPAAEEGDGGGAATSPPEAPGCGLQGWLLEVGSGEPHLLRYEAALEASFGSLEGLLRSCAGDGPSEHLFGAGGVSRLGHRRLFERWFRAHADAASGEHSAASDNSLPELSAVRDRELCAPPPPPPPPPPPRDEVRCSGTCAERIDGVASLEELREQFQLPEWLRENLERCGYEETTAAQRHAIPCSLIGRDVLVSAPPGSGKTLALLVPLIVAIPEEAGSAAAEETGRWPSKPLGLALAPVRERCSQVYREAQRLCQGSPFRLELAHGGADAERPAAAAGVRGADILVATPGRLLELVDCGAVSMQEVLFLALNDVDAMLDQGQGPLIRRLVVECRMPSSQRRQTMLLTAAVTPKVQAMSEGFLYDCIRVDVGRNRPRAEAGRGLDRAA